MDTNPSREVVVSPNRDLAKATMLMGLPACCRLLPQPASGIRENFDGGSDIRATSSTDAGSSRPSSAICASSIFERHYLAFKIH